MASKVKWTPNNQWVKDSFHLSNTRCPNCVMGRATAEGSEIMTEWVCASHKNKNLYIYLYTLAVSPSLGGSRQHKRTKTMGGFYSVLAMTRDPAKFGWHCWSNTIKIDK